MNGRANQPRDLVWSLEDFESPDNAMKFFEVFKNSFMIYSSSVEKLYCEYKAHLTGPLGRRRMVVLPDFNQFESIYSRVTNEAITETSIHVYPSVQKGKTRLILSGTASASGKLEKLPLKQGLRALKMGYFGNQKIVPALMLGDLREFPEKRLPYLKLHSVDCEKLSGMSDFEQKDISKGAWTKLESFL
jgi:hypothetical protein